MWAFRITQNKERKQIMTEKIIDILGNIGGPVGIMTCGIKPISYTCGLFNGHTINDLQVIGCLMLFAALFIVLPLYLIADAYKAQFAKAKRAIKAHPFLACAVFAVSVATVVLNVLLFQFYAENWNDMAADIAISCAVVQFGILDFFAIFTVACLVDDMNDKKPW